VSPPEKTRTVGFILDTADAVPLYDSKMSRPDFRLTGRPTPSCGKKSTDVSRELCLDKEFRE
jgi:hypothetical protein